MSLPNYPGAGLANVGSYLVSGIPHLTGGTLLSSGFATANSQQHIVFPKVTRTITVISRGAPEMRVHFDSVTGTGGAANNVISGSHYIPLSGSDQSITLNVKCRELFLSLADSSADCDFFIASELTTIRDDEMFILSGSGINE